MTFEEKMIILMFFVIVTFMTALFGLLMYMLATKLKGGEKDDENEEDRETDRGGEKAIEGFMSECHKS